MVEKTIVLSFPKSGRTWLRAIFGKLVSLESGESDNKLWSLSKRIASFTHNHSGIDPNKKLIILRRDPIDILISYYFHLKYREQRYSGDLFEFVRGKQLNNLKVWINKIDKIKIPHKTIWYEDLKSEPLQTIQDLLKYVSYDYSTENLNSALSFTEFNNLQKLSSEQYFDHGMLNAKSDNINTFKFRKGYSGQGKEILPIKDIFYIRNFLNG